MGARASNGRKTSQVAIDAKAKAARALALRKSGKTFAVIATEAGYNSPQAAHNAVMRALHEVIREPAEDVIRLELAHLDDLWCGQYRHAKAGDIQALGACLKIMERRAKLLGLDAPAKQEVTGKDGRDLLPQSGVLAIPVAIGGADAWEAAVKEQQAKLVGLPAPEASPATH